MLRDAQDQVTAYATKNKIPLSENAKHFFTLAQYNGGPGAVQVLLNDFKREGTLANDAFLTKKPTNSKKGQVYDNVMQRFQLANALTSEGHFDPDAPSQITSTPITDK